MTSTGRGTHQDSVQTSDLQRILFDKSCISLYKKILHAAKFFTKNILFNLFVIEFQDSYSVYIFIGSENNLNCNTEWLQQRNLCKTAMKPLSKNKPLVKSEHVRYKVAVESKQFWRIRVSHTSVWGVSSTSDCFVWKVTSERVAQRCDKTSCQGANEFLFTKTPLFEGFQQNSNRPNPLEMHPPTRYWCHAKIRGWRCKKKTSLRAALINQWTYGRLKYVCFPHWLKQM